MESAFTESLSADHYAKVDAKNAAKAKANEISFGTFDKYNKKK